MGRRTECRTEFRHVELGGGMAREAPEPSRELPSQGVATQQCCPN